MADGTAIEWTDITWQIVSGCAVVSPGCTNCYAMRLAGTRLRNHPSRAGLTRDSKAGPVWTGQVRFNEQWLDAPLRKRAPRMIFVAAHGDLFAEGVTDEMLDKVFAVMALAPQHTFQVLTKRPERMREYLGHGGTCIPIGVRHASEAMGRGDPGPLPIALPNVWLGVSVEDQKRADERIPVLLDTPAAVRWISAEPLLGPIDFDVAWYGESALDSECWGDCAWCKKGYPALQNCRLGKGDWEKGRSGLDWIVAGGESGPGARPMHPDWVRSIRDQCAAAGVPFLFKQNGAWAPVVEPASEVQEDDEMRNVGVMLDGQYMRRIGKKAAGRILDGVTHDGFPAVRP